MKIRDRIIGLERVPASKLLPNPKNWRRHTDAQANALRGLLSEIGFAGALLARRTKKGLMLIDGHLRAETAPDAKVPVLVLDVTEEEADKILATFDPLGAMAEADHEALRVLLEGISTESPDLQQLLDSLKGVADVHGAVAGYEKAGDDAGAAANGDWALISLKVPPETFTAYNLLLEKCPGLEPHEKFAALVARAASSLRPPS
jgi:hypothetical protein